MKTSLVAGVILGLLLVGWTLVMAVTGWYRDPSLLHMFWVGVAIQAVVLVVTLSRTRRGRRYKAQVGVGLMTSAVGSVVVFVGSLLVTGVLFTGYFADLREAQEQALVAEGMGDEEVQETLERVGPSQTPGGRAFAGFMGTLGTGLLVSLVAAAVLRGREPADAGPHPALR